MTIDKTTIWRYVRRFAIAALTAYLVWRLQQTVQLLLVSLFLAGAITPLVEWMERRKIERGAAVGIIYCGILLTLLLTIAPFPRLVVELGQFLTKLPELVRQIHIPDLSFIGITPKQVNDFLQSSTILEQFQTWGKEIANQTVNFTLKFVNALGVALLSLLITGYMVVNARDLLRKILTPFSKEARQEIYCLITPITKCLGAYVLGRIGTSALLGFCTYLALTFLSVPFAGALGLVVSVSNLIPFVGPFIGLVPMILAAWGQGFVTVGLTIGISFVLQQVEAFILQPWLVGPYLNLDPFELLLSIIIGAELLGVIGAVIAPPVAGIGRIIFERIYQRYLITPDLEVLPETNSGEPTSREQEMREQETLNGDETKEDKN